MKEYKKYFFITICIISIVLVFIVSCPTVTSVDSSNKKGGRFSGSYKVWFNNFEYLTVTDDVNYMLTEDPSWDIIGSGNNAWIVEASSDVTIDSKTNSTKSLYFERTNSSGEPDGTHLINIPIQPDVTFDSAKVKYLIFWARHNSTSPDNYKLYFNYINEDGSNDLNRAWSNTVGMADPVRITDQWRRYSINILDDVDWMNDSGAYVYKPVNLEKIIGFSIRAWDQGRKVYIDEIYLANRLTDSPPDVTTDYPEGDVLYLNDGD